SKQLIGYQTLFTTYKQDRLFCTDTRDLNGQVDSGYISTGAFSNQAHWTVTLPWSRSASWEKTLVVVSISVALHPTQRSTTVTSTLFPSRRRRIFSPQSGFAFGSEPRDAASKMMCDTAQMASESVLVMPQAPRAGV
ncbi:hypothetical protein T310_9410, partial [Rasamsonia emersonii CBS 393.64]